MSFWRPAVLDHGTMRPWYETASKNTQIDGPWRFIFPKHFQWVRLLGADNDRDEKRW